MNELETRSPGAMSAAKNDPYSVAALTPPVDVLEDSSGITLYADLPGVSKDKLQLQTEADMLTVEAELDIRCRRAFSRPIPRCVGPLSTHVPPEQGARCFQSVGKARGRCADTAHPEVRTRPATAHQGRLLRMQGAPDNKCRGYRL